MSTIKAMLSSNDNTWKIAVQDGGRAERSCTVPFFDRVLRDKQ